MGYRVMSGVGAVLVAAGSLVAGGGVAAADTVINGCTIVDNPTPEHHTVCPEADLSRVNLSDVDLSYANLSRTDLAGAVLFGADLSHANLSSAYLSSAHLPGAVLAGADLSGAALDAAYLSGADLSGADLGGADLGGADLGGADLGGADLAGADLGGADLGGADLGGADLAGADLGGAVVSGSTLMPQDPDPVQADATGGAVVSWVMPQGLVTGVILVGCEPESGTRFPVGDADVVCRFTTARGGEAIGVMTVTVDPADTGIVVAAPGPVTVDTPVQLVATLAPDTAAGTVQFRDANGPIGDPVTVDPNGTATLTHTFAGTGDHQITAEFVPAPDSGFAGSTSEPVTVTVTSQPGPAGSLGSAGSADIWNLIFGS